MASKTNLHKIFDEIESSLDQNKAKLASLIREHYVIDPMRPATDLMAVDNLIFYIEHINELAMNSLDTPITEQNYQEVSALISADIYSIDDLIKNVIASLPEKAQPSADVITAKIKADFVNSLNVLLPVLEDSRELYLKNVGNDLHSAMTQLVLNLEKKIIKLKDNKTPAALTKTSAMQDIQTAVQQFRNIPMSHANLDAFLRNVKVAEAKLGGVAHSGPLSIFKSAKNDSGSKAVVTEFMKQVEVLTGKDLSLINIPVETNKFKHM